VLIHTDVTDHKLDFERKLVAALRPRAWFGTLREFGDFWAARDKVAVDVERLGKQIRLVLAAPQRVVGLALRVPAGYRVASVEPGGLAFTQTDELVVVAELSGSAMLLLEEGGITR